MGLSSYKPVTKQIEIGGGEFFLVKGLSVTDVRTLVAQYYPDLEVIAERFAAIGQDVLETDNVNKFVFEIVRQAPQIVATIIALGNYEDEPTPNFALLERSARLLPFPVQTEALLALAELTFREAGGPKKFLATLATLISGLLPEGALTTGQEWRGFLTTRLTDFAGVSAPN